MNYGYFDDKNREYIITNPHTPIKWINYVGTLNFGGFVDHLGGSVICKGDPALNRITKYLPQLPDSSFNGETTYIKVVTKASTFVFSPYYVPTVHNYEYYKCRVGLGYTIYTSLYKGIETTVTVFVPLNSEVVLRKIEVTCRRDDVETIDIIPVVEYTHFDALKQFTNADWIPQTMVSKKDPVDKNIIQQYAFMKKNTAVNYFTSNVKIDSFETDRRKFLLDNQGGSWQNPLSLQAQHLSNSEANRGDNIAALMHKWTTVSCNETLTVITQLGQTESLEEERKRIDFYRNEINVDKAFNELEFFWREYLSTLNVKTPDEKLNSMINIHNPKQCFITKNWSRYLSLFQLGLGNRGIGIRDTSQDIMGVVANMPKESKEHIKILWSMQRRDGSAYHQYNPKTLIATVGDAHENEDLPDFYGDDHLWLILVTMTYLKETGDYDFLEEQVPFYDKDKFDRAIESSSVYEHINRAFNFTKINVGQNGLPLLGFADWNDTINLPKGSESLFNANLYGYGLKQYIELLDYLNQASQNYLKDYEMMKETFQEISWDGKWFIRYIDHNNEPLGSHKNEVGQIFTNGQSWAVISGFATDEQARNALDSVNDKLNTSKGIKLSAPGFVEYDSEKGGISSYPPGAKENGGIFLHANPWVIYAETLLGNGDRAYEYYNQINPISKNNIIEEYESPPYVYPQNILGDEHPQFGLARNCWLSGTASWCYQVSTQHILGVKADFKGLVINPCIPKDWSCFELTRKYRGSLYKISVDNTAHISKGVKEIKVDGTIWLEKTLPVGNEEYTVEVIMGD